MNESCGTLFGNTCHQFVMNSIDAWQITCLLLIPLSVPTLELARDVSLVPAEITKTNCFGTDGVNRGHGVNDGFAGATTRVNAEQSFCCFTFANDESINK